MADDVDRKLEAAMCDYWWLPDHAHAVSRPEIEYLVSPQDRKTLNTVIRVHPGLDDYGPLVREVMTAHRGRGSSWRIGAPSHSPRLAATVLGAGYEIEHPADAWSIDVSARRPAMPDHIRIERVEDLDGVRHLSQIMSAAFRSEPMSDTQLEEELVGSVGPDARCRRFVAYDAHNGDPLATGCLNLYPALGLGFMWGGSTVAWARGRGVYSALVTTRMKMAQSLGIQRLGLYARRNTSGLIVQAQGFEKHGLYFSWIRASTPAP